MGQTPQPSRNLAPIAFVLMAGVCIRHFTAHQLDEWLFTTRIWFYMLGALWEAMLCGIVAYVIYHASPGRFRMLALAAMFIGIAEALQMAGCRPFLTTKLPPGMDVCDHVTGLPVGVTFLAMYLIAVLWALWKSREQQ
jgi:hypothetical protein